MKFWSFVRSLVVIALFAALPAACGRADLPLHGGVNEGGTDGGFGGSSAGKGGGAGKGGSTPNSCSNGFCDNGEDPSSCPSDCFCGDGICNGNEPNQGCGDCNIGFCGNGVCE